MTPEFWMTHGPLFALVGVLLAVAALGWDPALRALTLPEPPPNQFRFHPQLLPAWLLLVLLLVSGSLTILLVSLTAHGVLLLVTPLLLVAVGRGALAHSAGELTRASMTSPIATINISTPTAIRSSILTQPAVALGVH